MKPVKKIALLHDLCGVGKAALTNMMPVLTVMGVEPCPIPTVLLSTHTGGYGIPAVEHISADYIRSCGKHYLEQGVRFDMIFVGYLGSRETIKAAADFLRLFPDTFVVLDPIMGDHGTYYCNFDVSYGAAIRELLPLSDLLLPNLTECFLLLNQPYQNIQTEADIRKLCGELTALGAKDMVITSIPVDGHPKGIAILENRTLVCIDNEESLSDYHGTGDVFDGMVTAGILNGKNICESVREAHAFVCACIRESSQWEYPEREGLMIEKSLQNMLHHLYPNP